ncbi:MAG: outer membrane lipoprotein chaperone LolA [Acidiferrobacterales bacterium]|nr:outer membrane lipoprotein chaperone LolA [Acidiferrobacterales bacterium]
MKRNIPRSYFFVTAFVLGAVWSSAFGSESTDRFNKFFSQTTTYFAEFHQLILDEGLHVVEETTGLMWMNRPDRFRWEYFEPFAQTIVGDGIDVWIYDPDLQQTTVRQFSEVVNRSAAEILAGMDNVEEFYIVEDRGVQGEIAWVSLKPKDAESGQFQSMHLGFDSRSLSIIQILENLGNTTRLQFYDSITNQQFDEATFQFELPDDVDLIDARE